MQNHYRAGVSLEAASLFLRVEVRLSTSYWKQPLYIFALPLVGFTEYDDNDDDDNDNDDDDDNLHVHMSSPFIGRDKVEWLHTCHWGLVEDHRIIG
ncbi:hypothetical protein Hanom_Chr07g00681571 [Helianthus anomalus]